jgi:hypothetical protein
MESELSAALPRRVLHDEVLPRLHLAIMRLESLRARILPAAVPAGFVEREVSSSAARDEALPAEIERGWRRRSASWVRRTVTSPLMRSAPMANLRRLEQGFAGPCARVEASSVAHSIPCA